MHSDPAAFTITFLGLSLLFLVAPGSYGAGLPSCQTRESRGGDAWNLPCTTDQAFSLLQVSHKSPSSTKIDVKEVLVLGKNNRSGSPRSAASFEQNPIINTATTLARIPAPDLRAAALPEFYHSGDGILQRFQQLGSNACPSGVPLSVELVSDKSGDAEDSRTLLVARLGNMNADKRAMLVANEHAREVITPEVALRFVEDACQGTGEHMLSLQESLKQNVRFTIVPMANLAGRKLVDDGVNPCQRYTADEGEGSIDLNRNMDVDFKASSDHGAHPFSTYQARILRDLAAEEQPLLYIDLHSGARSLMVSWGEKPFVNPDFADQKLLLDQVAARFCSDCKIGSNREVIAYENPGEVIDHMYATQNVKYSMLWEVWEGTSTGSDWCHKLFNPWESTAFESTVSAWSGAVGLAAEYMAQHISVDERSHPTAGQIAATKVAASLRQSDADIIKRDILTT